MRYDNWDVILFPRVSMVPIQEFRTACYASQDEQGRQLSTLTCYIASLPASTPFRISVHSWDTPAKPSALLESHRKPGQKVVFAVQVIVDGTRVFHGLYEATLKWPQEIVFERRSLADPQPPFDQRYRLLEFPPFHENVLMQRSWSAREHGGRIKVLLSEQTVRKSSGLGEQDQNFSHNIVCFAFQHAPKEILEQTGVSWPVRNPLYLTSSLGSSHMPQHPVAHVKSNDIGDSNQVRSSLMEHSPPVFGGSRKTDSYACSSTESSFSFSQLPKPSTNGRNLASDFWGHPLTDSLADSYEESSVGRWPTKRTTSRPMTNLTTPDVRLPSPAFRASRKCMNKLFDEDTDKDCVNQQAYREKGARQVVVALRDDQLGQLIEAISPSKQKHERELRTQHSAPNGFGQSTSQAYLPKMTDTVYTRTPTVALARKASYPDLKQHTKFKKLSPNQAYRPSYSKGKENREPTHAQETRLSPSYPQASRIPSPHPFTVPKAQMDRLDSAFLVRDPSSVFSIQSHLDTRPIIDTRNSIAVPTPGGDMSHKKKDVDASSASSPRKTHYEQLLIPELNETMSGENASSDKSSVVSSHTGIEDIINSDAFEKPFIPSHKSGMSSIDSTSRLEQKLFSALGEELSNFKSIDPTTGLEAGALPSLGDFEVPIMKRKRQGTFGGDRDRSPVAKASKEETGEAKHVHVELSGLGGGE